MQGTSSLGALRLVRLLRLLRVARLTRVARNNESLRTVVRMMEQSFKGMWPVAFLLVLFTFIFSILGMQVFGGNEDYHEKVRWQHFGWALLQTCMVLLGENWTYTLYYTANYNNVLLTAFFFMMVVVLGQWMPANSNCSSR